MSPKQGLWTSVLLWKCLKDVSFYWMRKRKAKEVTAVLRHYPGCFRVASKYQKWGKFFCGTIVCFGHLWGQEFCVEQSLTGGMEMGGFLCILQMTSGASFSKKKNYSDSESINFPVEIQSLHESLFLYFIKTIYKKDIFHISLRIKRIFQLFLL